MVAVHSSCERERERDNGRRCKPCPRRAEQQQQEGLQHTKDPHSSDLFIRTSYSDAALGLAQLDKGKAGGRRGALWMRARLQAHLFTLGCSLQRHAGKVLFVAILVLSTFCVALKSASIHTRVDQLWVQEGGRLERELRYSFAALAEPNFATHQLFIQTPKDAGASLLHPNALKAHLQVLQAATQVTVHLFDITWRLRDMCEAASVPRFEEHYIDQIFENMIPCSIITPLDCFWEGSKLLGPDYPVVIPGLGSKVRWTNLNPGKLVDQMKQFGYSFSFSTLEDYMKRAGISTGYQEKPCLDPTDPECPATAPNKKSGLAPDIGAELTGGCYGFAAKYMHWAEDLVVGGAKKNKTGHIQRGKALQTVIQLMGERELYEFWSKTYKVHHVDWTQEKAAIVLDAWQRRFSEEVRKAMKKDQRELGVPSPYNVYAFSTATLNDILGQFSELNVVKIAIGYVLMDPVRSQAGVGIAGVVLVSITVAAGLGFCALLGIAFNASTTQIVPFLALGLGVDDMFLITASYAEQDMTEVKSHERTGTVLKRTGLSVLLTSLSIMCALFAAAIIPIPALRVFSLQAAVLVLFNLGAMLLVFPAIVSLDLRRRASKRVDLLCCAMPPPNDAEDEESLWPCFAITVPPRPHYQQARLAQSQPRKLQPVTRALPPGRQHTVAAEAAKSAQECWVGSQNENADVEKGETDSLQGQECQPQDCWNLSLTSIASKYFAPFVTRASIKAFAMIGFCFVLAASLWGAMKVTDGLELTDIVPKNSDEHAFLSAQGRYFGFYSMYAVTMGDFEYPTNQKMLFEYHDAFMRIPAVIKNDDGGLPDFWLSMFRDWLMSLQKSFDRDWARGSITQERWFSNASDEGILAYKLLVQTGHVDNPIDKSLVTQVRLVDADGMINAKAFYNYLSAWASNDALAYGASHANLRPEPRQWFHAADDYELKIPKSAPLVYAQMPFYLHGLGDTESITKLIGQVRTLCERFEERGLPNYPSGIPFLFWEQYIGLRWALGLALASALGAVFVVLSILLLNLWAAILVVITLAGMVLQLLGLMGILGVKLSAVPAVLLIVAVGIGVHFTVHICLGFVTSIGGRDRRTRLAIEQMFAPVVHGAFTTLLAVLMLAFSEFDFIVRYFFYVLLALIAVGLINGLVFFPILLSLIGPSAEVVPYEFPDRISTPSPEPSPVQVRAGSCRVGKAPPSHSSRRSREACNRMHAEPSLTTITEEPGSCHSAHETIVVQPELVLETTTTTTHNNGNGGSGGETTSSARSSPAPGQTNSYTTKVTATAKVKVELHTPLSSSVERCESRRSSRSHYRSESRSGSSSGSGSDSCDGSGRLS
ncbi:hypothetical protein ONE63_005525 [Megalurothrips usitatus]|uniref:SSD domain-containing protein n=1 Tax=Megalurothrips usitatus TaxID=439358 RepID=A0AAV7Y1Z4_9NEOP|nr:hypothetical protein ONE63_005525 [Megalurothrips usitatus]